jgi:hypothetical protein
MTIDLLLFIGGVLGALTNRLAGANPTRSWATVGEVAVSGAIMVGLVALGLVPAEWRAAMEANPFRVGLFSFAAAFLIGPGLITLGKSFFYRVAPKNGTGDKTSPGVKLGALLLVVTLAGAGCATLGLQSRSVSFDRNGLLLAYADLQREYGAARELIRVVCAVKAPPAELCQRAAQAETKLAELDQRFRMRVLADDFEAGQVDWQALLAEVPKFLALAARLAI